VDERPPGRRRVVTPVDLGALRAEVRVWLQENVPANLEVPRGGRDLSPELMQWTLEFRRKLGHKGWLAPTWPTYFGGSGLSSAAGAVIQQELSRYSLPALPINLLWLTALRAWGTEEQKGAWLTPSLRGEITVKQILSEPRGGSDLAGQTTTALRAGDAFLVNGEKGYTSVQYPSDYLFILVVTNPEASGHERFSTVIVDALSPGVSTNHRRTLMGGVQTSYVLRDVWVPFDRLVGGEGNGWSVAQTVIDVERGGPGVTASQREEIEERERQYWGKRG
jgi:alkylation response protein AidB-like acyl-CoA dehydrogenase